MEELTKRAKHFDFESKKYEIKVFKSPVAGDDEEYIVQAFCEGKPANGYAYHVKFTTNYDFKNQYGFDAVSHLMETAESDVKNKV